MDDHNYWEEAIEELVIKDMKKHCPGCLFWDDYYNCIQGGIDNCVYNLESV